MEPTISGVTMLPTRTQPREKDQNVDTEVLAQDIQMLSELLEKNLIPEDSIQQYQELLVKLEQMFIEQQGASPEDHINSYP